MHVEEDGTEEDGSSFPTFGAHWGLEEEAVVALLPREAGICLEQERKEDLPLFARSVPPFWHFSLGSRRELYRAPLPEQLEIAACK